MANEHIFTTPETLSALGEKAKLADDFTVKVMRRGQLGPIVMANLSQALLQHFVNPELWVPSLCGGGKYSLVGYHTGSTEPTEQGKPVAGMVQFDIGGAPREVDISAVGKEGWRGPGVLDFPARETRTASEQLVAYQNSPPGSDQVNSATGNNQTWNRPPGGGPLRQEYPPNGTDNWQRGASALEAERRVLEKERLDAERQRHRDELEAQKKSHEADMRALKTEMMGAIQQQRPAGPDPTLGLMMEMMKASAAAAQAATAIAAEDRRAAGAQAAEDRRAAETQRSEDRRAQLAAQERQDARFAALLDKPKDDPLAMFKVVNELVSNNSKKNDGIVEAQSKMMHSMSDMMSQQVGVAMDFVSAAADMQLGAQGEKEPVWIKALEGVVKSVGAMAKGNAARRAPPPPGQEQLQPGQQTPPQQAQQAAPSVMAQVEIAIRKKVAPSVIAAALVEHYEDPSIQQALIESMGDPDKYLRAKLGNWANEDAVNNPVYLTALFAEIERQFRVAGIIPSEAPEEEAEIEPSGDPEVGDEEAP